jgi:hypothetical protein
MALKRRKEQGELGRATELDKTTRQDWIEGAVSQSVTHPDSSTAEKLRVLRSESLVNQMRHAKEYGL